MGSFANHVWREEGNRRVCIYCGAEVVNSGSAIYLYGGHFTVRDLPDIPYKGLVVGKT